MAQAREHGLPPAVLARENAMSDKFQAVLSNPYYLVESADPRLIQTPGWEEAYFYDFMVGFCKEGYPCSLFDAFRTIMQCLHHLTSGARMRGAL